MRKDSCEAQKPASFVDLGGLHCRNLMPAETLADNIQPARQRRVAKRAVAFTGKGGRDCRSKRLLWIGQFRLCLGKRCRDGADGLTAAVHGCPLCLKHQNSPHRIWIVWLGCQGRSLHWSPRVSEV